MINNSKELISLNDRNTFCNSKNTNNMYAVLPKTNNILLSFFVKHIKTPTKKVVSKRVFLIRR